MTQKNSNGQTADKSDAALLLIDVISDFEFEDGEKLFASALPMARRLAEFKKKAKESGIPVIYINDNFGKWQEDFKAMVEYLLNENVRGREIAELLEPDDDDYYILKPKHSAFYSTALDLLLKNFEAKTLILTGVSTDICILFSANDAYMRDYRLFIPNDCVAAIKPEDSRRTLQYVERVLKADIRASTEIVDELKKLNKFKEVAIETSNAKAIPATEEAIIDTAKIEPESTLRLVGTITEYKEGNRTARYLVGFGAGRAKIKAQIKILDAKGATLLEKDVDGNLVIGFFGGDSKSITRGLAREVAKVTEKKFF